jgi:hypothetical protein
MASKVPLHHDNAGGPERSVISIGEDSPLETGQLQIHEQAKTVPRQSSQKTRKKSKDSYLRTLDEVGAKENSHRHKGHPGCCLVHALKAGRHRLKVRHDDVISFWKRLFNRIGKVNEDRRYEQSRVK